MTRLFLLASRIQALMKVWKRCVQSSNKPFTSLHVKGQMIRTCADLQFVEAICSGVIIHVWNQTVLFTVFTDRSLRRRRTSARILTESRVCRSTLGSVARVREQISFHSDVGEGKALAEQSSEEKFDTALWVIDPLLMEKQFHLRTWFVCKKLNMVMNIRVTMIQKVPLAQDSQTH